MEETIVQSITSSLGDVLDIVNWLFIAIVVLVSWLVNELVKKATMPKWLNWFKNLNSWRALTIGTVVLIPLFAYFGRFETREEFFGLFISLMVSMVLYAIGIKYVIGWVKAIVLKIKTPAIEPPKENK